MNSIFKIFTRFDDSARDVMIQAESAAERWNHQYLGTEHILLGMIKGSGAAIEILKALDIDLSDIRLQIEQVIYPGSRVETTGEFPYTPRAKKAIENALEEALASKCTHIASEHILLGLLRESSSVAFGVLTTLGLKIEDVRERAK